MPFEASTPPFRNEYDWEKELRRDDERVRTYLSELPTFIDLPQEDAVILKRIQCREERIPHAIPLFQEKWDPDLAPDPEEEREARDAWFRRDGADIFLAGVRLARGFAVLFAMDPISGIEMRSGLRKRSNSRSYLRGSTFVIPKA